MHCKADEDRWGDCITTLGEETKLAAGGGTGGCADGYTKQDGDIDSNWGEINGKGGGKAYDDCDECAQHCNSEATCKSYECSVSEFKCNLNDVADPNTSTNYKDYTFCTKGTTPSITGAMEEQRTITIVPEEGISGLMKDCPIMEVEGNNWIVFTGSVSEQCTHADCKGEDCECTGELIECVCGASDWSQCSSGTFQNVYLVAIMAMETVGSVPPEHVENAVGAMRKSYQDYVDARVSTMNVVGHIGGR